MRKHRVFSTLIKNQKESYELIMTSVLIAVGVNLLSTGVVELVGFEHKNIVFIIIGAIISIGVIFRITSLKLRELNQTTKIDGFMIFDEKNHKIVNVPEYKISNDMVDYLNSAFSENKALEKLWKHDNINPFKVSDEKMDESTVVKTTRSGAIFIELLEYCVIEKLSTHLSSYFDDEDEKPHVQEFRQIDIPEVLLSNRFLKLFSEDIRNRAIFSEDHWDNDEMLSTLISARNISGGYYQKFDLKLPEKSKISRKNKNEIVIETPILTLTLTSIFDGDGTVLKSGFYKYYLGIKDYPGYYWTYKFNVEVAVKFKVRSLFSKEKEIYYAWIDSFLDCLSSYMCKDDFFERINWDVVYTIMLCEKNTNEVSVTAKNK